MNETMNKIFDIEAELGALRAGGQALLDRCGYRLLDAGEVPEAVNEVRADWEGVLAEVRWVATDANGGAAGDWRWEGRRVAVLLDADGDFHVTGRSFIDHLAYSVPAERASVRALALEHGLPPPLESRELEAMVAETPSPSTARRCGYLRSVIAPDYDVAAFLMVGRSLARDLTLAQRLVVHAVCRRLSDIHGIALRCVPIGDFNLSGADDALDCLVGHVLGAAFCEELRPIPIDEGMHATIEAVSRLPEAVWTEIAASVGAAWEREQTRVILAATGPLAGGALGYGVLFEPSREERIKASGDDPDDYDDESEGPDSWDWDELRPAGAPEMVYGNRLDQMSQEAAVAGVTVSSSRRWDWFEVDLGPEAHASFVDATAQLGGEKRYWIMAWFS